MMPAVPPPGFPPRERYRFWRRHGYLPHLRHPRSFNEKLTRLCFYEPPEDGVLLADKWCVRDFVRGRVGEEFLNPVIGAFDRVEDIPFDTLPDAYAIKMNNASGRNILVADKASADVPAIRAQLGRWLVEPFGLKSRETWYLSIAPRIVIEPFLRGGDGAVPPDYKAFVFHGTCHFIQVDTDRFGKHNQRFYNRVWTPQDFAFANPLGHTVSAPRNLPELIRVAEALGAGMSFVRVDLYLIDDEQIRFGEMTLAPHGGFGRFTPRAADFRLGALW